MKDKLTLDVFGNGVREGLDAVGEVPGVPLDEETQPFAAVHFGLHLLQELWRHTINTFRCPISFSSLPPE